MERIGCYMARQRLCAYVSHVLLIVVDIAGFDSLTLHKLTNSKLKINNNMELQFKEQFHDARVIVIPGTRQKTSRTQQNEQLTEWMKRTKHIPLQYMWENGIKVELSDIFEAKIKDALQRGYAIGADGRKYTFEEPDNLFPICSSICVRAKAEGESRSDAYGVDFFV